MSTIVDKKSTSSKADELIAWLRHWAEHYFNPLLADERRSLPPNILLDLGNQGIFGMNVPKKYNGLDLDPFDYYRVLGQIAAIDISLATLLMIHLESGVAPIAQFGSEKIKETYLPLMAAGMNIGAIGLTEPAFGTNFLDMQSRGVQNDGQWILNGVKRWNSSNWANVVNVFAICKGTNPEGRGMTGFVVPHDTPGVTSGPEALTMGLRSIVQSSIILENVALSDDYLLGKPYEGFKVLDTILPHCRLTVGVVSHQAMKRALQLVSRFLRRRRSMTGKLIDHPVILEKADAMISAISSLEAWTEDIIHSISSQEKVPAVITMLIKVGGSELAIKTIKDCLYLAGGRGYMENNHLSRLYRDVLCTYFGEGANDSLFSGAGAEIEQKDGFFQFMEKHHDIDELWNMFKLVVMQIRANKLSKNHLMVVWPAIAKTALFLCLYYPAKKRGHERAVYWAKKRVVKYLHRLRDRVADSTLPNSVYLNDEISRYQEAIGDIDFQMLGEEHAKGDIR